MRPLLAALGLASLTVACAGHGAGPGPAMAQASPAAQRGQAIAERRCSGCHVVGLDDRDGAAGPRFRDLRLRFNGISLQRRFGEISAHGSGQMPPIQITAAEAEDLVAYFESLDGR
jgi:mono/diheme cytochrome c family protein